MYEKQLILSSVSDLELKRQFHNHWVFKGCPTKCTSAAKQDMASTKVKSWPDRTATPGPLVPLKQFHLAGWDR
jgi:hypothetical protein